MFTNGVAFKSEGNAFNAFIPQTVDVNSVTHNDNNVIVDTQLFKNTDQNEERARQNNGKTNKDAKMMSKNRVKAKNVDDCDIKNNLKMLKKTTTHLLVNKNGTSEASEMDDLIRDRLRRCGLFCSTPSSLSAHTVDCPPETAVDADHVPHHYPFEMYAFGELYSDNDSGLLKRRGPRTSIRQEQLEVLNDVFTTSPKPSKHARAKLSIQTGLSMRVIQACFYS